jgi:dihydrodipicolinate reductase
VFERRIRQNGLLQRRHDGKTTPLIDVPNQLALESAKTNKTLPIVAVREGEIPGTHTIARESAIDTITIQHEAHNRTGFALGALVAAKWLVGKQGCFSMRDIFWVGSSAIFRQFLLTTLFQLTG